MNGWLPWLRGPGASRRVTVAAAVVALAAGALDVNSHVKFCR